VKRVLVISYYWPPSGGSGVQRWAKFAKYLPAEGWQPVIYTPLNPNIPATDTSLLDEIPEEVEVLKNKIFEPGSGKKKEVNPINFQKKSLKQKILLWIRGNCFIPDPKMLWIKPSVKFLKQYLEDHPVDAVISTGPPHSMHLIARNLMRELRRSPNAPKWIADFRDPWTQLFYFKHLNLCRTAEKLHFKLEKSVVEEADGIIAVTPFVQADFQKMTSKPVYLITNGFDESDFLAEEKPENNNFRFVHTGLFASDGNPVEFWEALGKEYSKNEELRQSLKITLAGKVDGQIIEAIKSSGLGGALELPGYLPHSETVKLQKSASVLFLPLRREPEYAKVYPGKIFEYLASRRPVLGIGQSEGAASRLLDSTGAGKMFEWEDGSASCAWLMEKWAGWKAGESDKNDSGSIESYSRRELTKKLCEIL